MLDPLSEILLNKDYKNNEIYIYLGENDELLDPNFTKEFAKNKNIEIISFAGDHAGTDSLKLIIENIKNS